MTTGSPKGPDAVAEPSPADAGTLAGGGRKHQSGGPAYTQGLPTAELRARLTA